MMYIVAILFIVTCLFTWKLKQSFGKKQNLPPGPVRWPIVGSLPAMIKENGKYPHLQMSGLAKKYGGIMSLGYGVHYAVVVSDFEMMQDLYRRKETNTERYRFDFLEQRNDFKNLGIIFSYGEVWREQKKYTMKLLRQFGFGKRYTMDEAIYHELKDLFDEVETKINGSGGVWEVDINRIAGFSINILWASVGGYRFDPHSSKIKRHLQLSQRIFESVTTKNLLGIFPFLKIFPVWSGYREHYNMHREVKEFIWELVEDAKQKREGRTEPESFIEAYLDEIESRKGEPQTIFNEDQFILTLMDLFLGGSDTTATASTWILYYLTLYPEVQKKVREELDRHRHHGAIPFPSILMAEMHYTKAVILEVMRHAPYITLWTPRMVTDDIEVGEYNIPKGTMMFANMYSIFHDEKYWGDPEVFRPERLLLPDGTFDHSKIDRLQHFGIGPRHCPGENMGMTALFMLTTSFVSRFTMEAVEGREPSLELGIPSITMTPLPFVVKLTPLC